MSINTKEDANKYYQVINELIDEYVDKWKIRPMNLKKYLKPGSKRFYRFLERNNLSEIKGIDVVLTDVLDDRFSMESDGVLTFETYKFFESNEFKIKSLKECLYKGIEKADIKMEKIIADHFDTNLGEIDVVDSEKHLFKISSWGKDGSKVIIYSKDDIDIIIENMVDHLFDELSKSEVKLTDSISIELIDLINKENFNEKMKAIFTEKFTISVITECLDGFEFDNIVDDYYIWSM